MPSQQSVVLFRIPARGVSRRELRAFAARLEDEVAEGRGFNCVIADDAELRRLNRDFANHDYPTDVLSFPAVDAIRSIGEIAISFDRAREQAAELGHTVELEIKILMLHGVLHLTGLDHERDRGQMALAERRWRKHFGLPAGLIERVRA
jgi:probable rRNA maturation factor